jgi:hypothetical protein
MASRRGTAAKRKEKDMLDTLAGASRYHILVGEDIYRDLVRGLSIPAWYEIIAQNAIAQWWVDYQRGSAGR